MIVSGPQLPVTLPIQKMNPAVQEQKAKKGDNAADFDKMLTESNALKQNDIEKEKSIVGNGEFHLGETKNDKEFREQLEKITGKKQTKGKNKLDQNDYLTLLVTQLKYQDPSKPMEHYEMASQMAQFNTVEQLVGVNKTLKNLDQSQAGAKADKLSQYMDKFVEVQGNQLKLNDNHTTSIAKFNLPIKSSGVTLEIKDSLGKSVRNVPLGGLNIGTHEVHWDGKNQKGVQCTAGKYTFAIHASTEDGKEIKTQSSYLAKVTGVTDILSGGKLDTTAGPVDPIKIVAIRNYEPKSEIKNGTKNISAQKEGDLNGIHQ